MRLQKAGTIVVVSWADAFSTEDWSSVAETLEYHDVPVPTITVGIVIAHTDKSITIVRSYQEQEGDQSTVEGTFNIPCGMIKDIKKLSYPIIDIKT